MKAYMKLADNNVTQNTKMLHESMVKNNNVKIASTLLTRQM